MNRFLLVPVLAVLCLPLSAQTAKDPVAEGLRAAYKLHEKGDQAALAGILNTIYELHAPLLSVQRLDDDAPPGDTGR